MWPRVEDGPQVSVLVKRKACWGACSGEARCISRLLPGYLAALTGAMQIGTYGASGCWQYLTCCRTHGGAGGGERSEDCHRVSADAEGLCDITTSATTGLSG